MTMTRVILAAAALALTGCASQTIRTEDARHAPADQLLAGYSTAEAVKVVVKRSDTFIGSACNDRVFADAKPVADLARGEKVEFTLSPGRHIVGVERQGICGGRLREISGEFKAGEPRTFLVETSLNFEYIFQETAF